MRVRNADTHEPDTGVFQSSLSAHSLAPLARGAVTTVQVNLGKVCNQACSHCHVDAGPSRTEDMSRATIDRILDLVASSTSVKTVDITGGAPELNAGFRHLVRQSRALNKHVIDRCNLTVLMEPGMDDLADFLAANAVHVMASLPCYTSENVDAQRGNGVYGRSIEALKLFNSKGYGMPGSKLFIDLVYNPGGAHLPGPQDELEKRYREELYERHQVQFNNLLTLTNLPVLRFAEWLHKRGQYESYMQLLVDSFNAATAPSLMCRSMVSVSWDGGLYDCDFNQMLELAATAGGKTGANVWQISDLDNLANRNVLTGDHCLGCTAGVGSSCGGALV